MAVSSTLERFLAAFVDADFDRVAVELDGVVAHGIDAALLAEQWRELTGARDHDAWPLRIAGPVLHGGDAHRLGVELLADEVHPFWLRAVTTDGGIVALHVALGDATDDLELSWPDAPWRLHAASGPTVADVRLSDLADAPSIVVVPDADWSMGDALDAASPDDLACALADAGANVAVPDHEARRLVRRSSGGCTAKALAVVRAAIGALRDATGRNRVTVLGHGAGAALAVRVAREEPSVERCVLVTPFTRPLTEVAAQARSTFDDLRIAPADPPPFPAAPVEVADEIGALSCPVFLALAEKDYRSASTHVDFQEACAALAPSGPRARIKRYPRLDHRLAEGAFTRTPLFGWAGLEIGRAFVCDVVAWARDGALLPARSDLDLLDARVRAPIPPDPLEAASVLARTLDAKELAAWAAEDEDQAVASAHFGLGWTIRNRWFWGRGNRLTRWFREHGVVHPDAMSSAVLRGLHRRLSGRAPPAPNDPTQPAKRK